MKLYTYWRSQASFRVRIALRLKGLVAETVSLDLLKGDQFDATYRALNPEMVVPTLLDGDGPPLVQSLAILEYLEEAYPQPPLLRAVVVQVHDAPVAVRVGAVGDHAAGGERPQCRALGVIGAQRHEPGGGHRPHQLGERRAIRVEARIDVRVIPFESRDTRGFRARVEKLRPRIPWCRRVLV